MTVDVNLFLSISSFVVSILAIWQSWQYYSKSKESEKNTSLALEAIKTQSTVLERLTGKWMDRLTRYVTSPQPADETTTKLLELITVTYTGMGPKLSPPTEDETKKQLVAQLISIYIAVFYYCGITNIASQGYLSTNEEEADVIIRGTVDNSHTDYFSVLQTLSGISDGDLRASPLYNLYEAAIGWKQSIKTSSMNYAERSTT